MRAPVTFSASRTGQKWIITLDFMEPRLKEVFYRIGDSGPFRTTGHTDAGSSGTGRPVPRTWITLPPTQKAVRIWVKYSVPAGLVAGPYELTFDPLAETVRFTRHVLGLTAASWVALREFDGKLLLYFTHLLCYRDAVSEIRYSLDAPALDRTFPLPPPAPANEIPDGADVYLEIPAATRAVHVKLIYADGTESELRRFERP